MEQTTNDTGPSEVVELSEKEELSLPPWFRPDPLARDKGKLLYLEEWGLKGRFHDRFLVFVVFLILSVAVFMFLIGLFSGDLVFAFIFMSVGTLIFQIGFFSLSFEFEMMPFCIYENGFSLVKVSGAKRWHREEEFIPWSELQQVSLKEHPSQSFPEEQNHLLFMKFKGWHKQILGSTSLSDPMAALDLLIRFVPETIDEKIKTFLASVDDREAPAEFMKNSSDELPMDILCLCMSSFLILGGMKFLHIGAEKGEFLEGFAFFLLVFVGGVGFFALGIGAGLESFQKWFIRRQASGSQKGIVIPRTLIGKLKKRVRGLIPWEEVRDVRLKLYPTYFFLEGWVELVSGEVYPMPYQVYKTAKTIPGFELCGRDLVNLHPGSSKGPIERWNYQGVSLLGFLVLLPSIIFLLFWLL